MPKKLKFISIICWILFSRGFDAYCTMQHTPDLSKEANPLVSVLGISSWTFILGIIGILTLYICFAFYKSVFHPISLEPTEKGLNFREYAAFLYLGERTHWSAMLYKYPKDLKRLHQYFGSVLTACLIYAGIISTLMWLLIQNAEWYREIHTAGRVYFFLIGGSIQIIITWNWQKYKIYRSLAHS